MKTRISVLVGLFVSIGVGCVFAQQLPSVVVTGDGEGGRYTGTFAAYLSSAGVPAQAARDRRDEQYAQVLVRLTFGRESTRQGKGDVEVKVGDYKVDRRSDTVTRQSISVSASGYGKTWAKTIEAQETDTTWRVRGDDGEAEVPRRRSQETAVDQTLKALAQETAQALKSGYRQLQRSGQFNSSRSQAPRMEKKDDLAPLFQEEVRSSSFTLELAFPESTRKSELLVSSDSKALSEQSILAIYSPGSSGRKCLASVRWDGKARGWIVEREFSVQSSPRPGDRAELQ